MNQLKTHIITVISLMLLVSASAFAATECNVSRQAGTTDACPAGAVGAASLNATWNGARVDPHSVAKVAIDAFGYCRYVGNTGDTPLFVPFGYEDEWRAYLTNHPSSTNFTQCSRGGSIPVPPNFGKDGASNMCVTVPPIQNITAPYKPVTLTGNFTAPAVNYVCKSGDGTEFTESAVATLESHDSGYGPSSDIGWKITKILYAYNGKCGAAKGVEVKTAPTSGLCSVGVPSAVIGTGPFTWICASGTGGGKNVTCSTGSPCEISKVDEKPCHCEDPTHCYRAVYWQDTCGHSWLDKTKLCEVEEPAFKPQPDIDYDSDFLRGK